MSIITHNSARLLTPKEVRSAVSCPLLSAEIPAPEIERLPDNRQGPLFDYTQLDLAQRREASGERHVLLQLPHRIHADDGRAHGQRKVVGEGLFDGDRARQ